MSIFPRLSFSILIGPVSSWPILYLGPFTALVFFVFLPLLLLLRLGPSTDAREPPLAKPCVPLIGHLVGATKYQTAYLRRLNRNHSFKAVTLPVLTGKLYAIYSPPLVQAAFKNPLLSLLPIANEAARQHMHLSAEATHAYQTTGLQDDLNRAIVQSSTGRAAGVLNTQALDHLSRCLAVLSQKLRHGEVTIEHWYGWVRDTLTLSTVSGLFGDDNIINEDPSLLDDLWAFEAGLSDLTTAWFPRYTAARASKAKGRLQAALRQWYSAHKYEAADVSAVVKARARMLQSHGFTNAEISEMELGLLHVSTSNTIPVAFWLTTHVLSRKSLVEEIREELALVVDKQNGGKTICINVKQLDERCPLLVDAWKESLRISIHAGHFRRVLEDTIICDSDPDQTAYLLKKGTDVLLSSDVSHSWPSAWANAPAEFRVERHSSAVFDPSVDQKERKAAYHPFGNGKHLCPGRSYAYAEIVGLVVVLIMGFDFAPLHEGGWHLPKMDRASFFEAAAKPENGGKGFGVRITARKGWEGVGWELKHVSSS